jgi:SAM-dependent methyltransferase
MPDESELRQYNAAYFARAHGGQESLEEAMLLSSALARLRLEHIKSYLVTHRMHITSVLEVGAGHGFLYQHLQAQFPGIRYVAVESDTLCQGLLRNLGALVFPDLESVPAENTAPFSLAIASHVLEHTSDPVAFVTTVSRLLGPGGTLFIEVPCRDYEFKRRHEPHLLFFDKQPLQRLLRILDFVDISTSYHGKELDRIKDTTTFAGRVRTRLAKLSGRIFPPPRELSWLGTIAERRIVAFYQAHLTKPEPSWWLRALARRRE